MDIKIKRIEIRNFKGIQSLAVDFQDRTQVSAANGLGKTTIMDAFTWLLFGKDSADKKDFNIIPLNAANEKQTRLETEVVGVLDIDGSRLELKKVFKTKWVKKHGEAEAEITGTTTEFFANDVPLKAGEFSAKIDSIIPEEIFKLLTNPRYFNSLKREKRQELLFSIAGDINEAAILGRFEGLAALLVDKTAQDLKKELSAKKTKLKEQIKQIPGRLDENQRMTPAPLDWAAIESEITEATKKRTAIEAAMTDASKAMSQANENAMEAQRRVYAIEAEIRDLTNQVEQLTAEPEKQRQQRQDAAKTKRQAIENNIEMLTQQLKSDQEQKDEAMARIAGLTTQIQGLRNEWIEKNAETFKLDHSETACPVCGQDLPADQVENKHALLEGKFNAAKQQKLNSLVIESNGIKKRIQDNMDLIAKVDEFATKYQGEIDKMKAEAAGAVTEADAPGLVDQAAINVRQERIKELTAEAEAKRKDVNIAEKPEDTNAQEERAELTAAIDSAKARLSARELITTMEARRQEILDNERALNQELADLERVEFQVDSYQRTRIEEIEAQINGKFETVKFKMYELQYNGGEREVCETLIAGVPYDDANNAARINAGIEIINAMAFYYQTKTPIFVDNAESVNQLQPTESQLIALTVSTDKSITIKHV